MQAERNLRLLEHHRLRPRRLAELVSRAGRTSPGTYRNPAAQVGQIEVGPAVAAVDYAYQALQRLVVRDW
jgi:hypothetical protein